MGRFGCVLCGSVCSRSCFHKHQDQYACHNKKCHLHAPGTTVVDDSIGETTDWYSISRRRQAGESSTSSSDGPSGSVRYVYFESSDSDSGYDYDSDTAFSDGPSRPRHARRPSSSKNYANRPKEHRRRGADGDSSRSSRWHHPRRDRHPEPHPGFAPQPRPQPCQLPYVPVSGYGYVPPPPGAHYYDNQRQPRPPHPDPRFFAQAPRPDRRFFAHAPQPDPRFYTQMPPDPRYNGFTPGGAPTHGHPRSGQGRQQQQGQKPKEPFRYEYAGTEEPDSDDGKKQKK